MARVFASLFAVVFFLLSQGCASGDGFEDLQRYIVEVKARPKKKIDELPKFEAYEAFTYRTANRRSPFSEPVILEETEVVEKPKSNVKPDPDRPKEPLEQVALGSMNMVGSILKENEKTLYALVTDGKGGIHRVREGNYLGKNHGRIVSVSDNAIQLIEIVADGQDGWFERPRSLGLREN